MLPFLTPRQQLAISAALLLVAGFLLVVSASIHIADTQTGNPFHYSLRHGLFIAIAVGSAVATLHFLSLENWQRLSPLMMFGGFLILCVVLVPGIGHEVNGSQRWIPLPLFNVQPSEFAKIGLLAFMADYLARRREQLDDWRTVVKPLGVLGVFVVLLLAQPDFGTSMVMLSMVFALLLLAGLPVRWLAGLVAVGTAGVVFLVTTQAYRLKRLTSFLDPWQHQFDSGYQLVQSLIAFGRGELMGVGLGSSVQKLFYLPEAHTDFVFAVAAEEFGLLGVVVLVSLFVLLVGAILRIARDRAQAGDEFGAFFAWGTAVLFGVQAFINMGVNMGLLPTKGLTLPLVSYGGSSLVASCVLLAVVWQLGAAASGATKVARVVRPARPVRGTVNA